jgi:streptogramin lyase
VAKSDVPDDRDDRPGLGGRRRLATGDGQDHPRRRDAGGEEQRRSTVDFPVANHIPTAITLGPDGNIWVTCNVPGTIPVIDPSANAIVKIVDTALGNEPTGIAFA